MELIRVTRDLTEEVGALDFTEPVTHVYNPLDYAAAPHELYLERFAKGSPDAVFIGMNPGPFGMAQTGVPFGDVHFVREWMGIEAPVRRPAREHPKRPVQGFACSRREVSGSRLWGWAQERFDVPERFFERFFVVNYCPLCFMEKSGRNRTPDKLPLAERDALYAACDTALRLVVDLLAPRWVLGIGKFAEHRARRALAGHDVSFGSILNPSPASPLANRGWAAQAEAQLRELSLL